MRFKEYIENGKVKQSSPDLGQARSLLLQGIERMQDVKSLHISEQNASFRFESTYESIREALQAFMAYKGYKPYSHEAVIVYANENKIIDAKEARKIDRYRMIRSDIVYRAEKVSIKEAKEALEFAEKVIRKIKSKAKF